MRRLLHILGFHKESVPYRGADIAGKRHGGAVHCVFCGKFLYWETVTHVADTMLEITPETDGEIRNRSATEEYVDGLYRAGRAKS